MMKFESPDQNCQKIKLMDSDSPVDNLESKSMGTEAQEDFNDISSFESGTLEEIKGSWGRNSDFDQT